LFAGYSKDHGFQLFQSDPSGNFAKWKATAIGANTQSAQSVLKAEYNDTLTLEEAQKLAVKILSRTMDSTVLTAEKRKSYFPSFLHFLLSSFPFLPSSLFPFPVPLFLSFFLLCSLLIFIILSLSRICYFDDERQQAHLSRFHIRGD
jgi:hypothetical protein